MAKRNRKMMTGKTKVYIKKQPKKPRKKKSCCG